MDDYKKVTELLEELDRDEGLYTPSSRTYEQRLALIEEIERVKREIELLISEKMKISKNTQDASFIARIWVEVFMKTDKFPSGMHLSKLSLSFSNFGRLVTIEGTDPTALENYPLDKIIDLLSEHSFIYISRHYLEQEYTGRHDIEDIETWLDRFFTYI